MPFSFRETLDWLYESGTEAAFGPKQVEPLWLTDPKTQVPINTYRRALVLLTDPSGMVLSRYKGQLQDKMPELAAEGGFRLLKVQPITLTDYSSWPELKEVDHQLFSAYIASDVFPKTLGEFSALMWGAPIIMGLADATLSERATLDALWVARGEGKGLVGDLDDLKTPTIKHRVDVWPLVGLGVAAVAVGLGIWAMTSKFEKGHRYA